MLKTSIHFSLATKAKKLFAVSTSNFFLNVAVLNPVEQSKASLAVSVSVQTFWTMCSQIMLILT